MHTVNIRVDRHLGRRSASSAGFGLVELLLASAVILVASSAAVMYVTRNSEQLTRSRHQAFARQRALSMLEELRVFIERDAENVAEELDQFDDGSGHSPVLTIAEDALSPTGLVDPDHAASGNTRSRGAWDWYRQVRVKPMGEATSRDLRLVTVRIYRRVEGAALPGDLKAEVSTVIRTIGEAYPATQVYDLYVLAIENAPSVWVNMDSMQPVFQAALSDLQARNPGLKFRVHWITKMGYGRDDEYAPYINDTRTSTDATPWTYVYPGTMPPDLTGKRYYVPSRIEGRVNVDGTTAPNFANGLQPAESYVDSNKNGRYDAGESFLDDDGDGMYDEANEVPYALADMHNHCMRWPEAEARSQARVAAGLEDEDTPTYRLLLDRMASDPDRYHNAIIVNLHGELVPLPPVRNVSDAAKDPELRPGWRVVTHPELLRPLRVAGDDAESFASPGWRLRLTTPRFRVYAYRSEFLDTEPVMSQQEPLMDLNGNGVWDTGETFSDWNGNGSWDAGLPISIVIEGGNFASAPNAPTLPSMVVKCLAGGVDADGSGAQDPYEDWTDAPVFPESFTDSNDDGIRQVTEPWLDLNEDGARDPGEPYQDLDGDGNWSGTTETLSDVNGNGVFDQAKPAEPFTDANGNNTWDAEEPYWDRDGNGTWTPPTSPVSPYRPWAATDQSSPDAYIASYGEPFKDLDGDETWDPAESFSDLNANGIRDGGFERGEMWLEVEWQATEQRTVLHLHGTPIDAPYEASTQRGLSASTAPSWIGLQEVQRLYDLDYVPCPTPSFPKDTDRFEMDLYTAHGSLPKNTARWTIELPVPAVRRGFESTPGANDGDQVDRIITLATRIGRDLTTGTKWPVRNKPANVSRTYAYYCDALEDVPFSERYQFQGDPRHSPYADTDRSGPSFSGGYNWYFDDFTPDDDGTVGAQLNWDAFAYGRLGDGWMWQGGSARGGRADVPRLLMFLRTAIANSEVVYTTLTGFSFYYLSLGGDVGAHAQMGAPDGVPMDGTPFGISGAVTESTLWDASGGTQSLRGGRKYVRSNDGSDASSRSGGYWWSKPWLGELCPDTAYASQWVPAGNLGAATGSAAGTFRLILPNNVTVSQQPFGTIMMHARGMLAHEGCTSFFNIGEETSTFHHQFSGGTGSLVLGGLQLASNYAFDIPTTTVISRPFGLSTTWAGGVGEEFSRDDTYPRWSAELVTQFYDHQDGETGSGIVRLTAPAPSFHGGPSGEGSGYLVMNGLADTAETGTSFIARYAVVSLLHSLFVAGEASSGPRIRQLPRIEITRPLLTTEIVDPETIAISWKTEWRRWDGKKYTDSYTDDFKEDESELRYVVLYSRDSGETWLNVRDNSVAETGKLPWIDGVGVDADRTFVDVVADGNETFAWPTPPDVVPGGSYLIRVEAYRENERQHYAQHAEKIYVDR